jgi:hypothetical protein
VFPVLITVSDDLREMYVKRWQRAIELYGWTELRACQEMLLKQSQWCDQKSGREPLSFTRLMLLPFGIHAWFSILTLIECGLPVEMDSFMSLFDPRSKKRMAKTTNETSTERRQDEQRTA